MECTSRPSALRARPSTLLISKKFADPLAAASRRHGKRGRAARPASAASSESPARRSACRRRAAGRTALRRACPRSRRRRALPGPRRRAASPSSRARPGTPRASRRSREARVLLRDDLLDLLARHRGQAVVPVDVVPRVDADGVPRGRGLAHPGDGLLPAADVGRREERPVEHRAKAVRRRRAGGEDLLHEALPEDALDRLAARVGPEREEERRPEAVLPEEIDEPRDSLERPAVRVDVDLEGEDLQTSGGFRPLR